MLLAAFNLTIFPFALVLAAGWQWRSVRVAKGAQPPTPQLLRMLGLPKLVAMLLLVGALPVVLLFATFLASVFLPDDGAVGVVAALCATVGPSQDRGLGRLAVASMVVWSLLSAAVATRIDARATAEVLERWGVTGLSRSTVGMIAVSWVGAMLVWHELIIDPWRATP